MSVTVVLVRVLRSLFLMVAANLEAAVSMFPPKCLSYFSEGIHPPFCCPASRYCEVFLQSCLGGL